ncbi:putative octanoyltransferase [Madurella mycetomatis]|uniref:Octanoyltransferase n=1 Tax=Madurella mycetomatis TaxID=100816 RepID=A0A175W106_9PEZI|nr:putative octanoyltransferase [Madurella mycetomatis]
MRLRHLHLPSIHPLYIPYSLASLVQQHARRQHLDYKDDPATTSSGAGAPPPPTLISFTPHPIYTLGRRQTAPLSPDETARLTAPLHVQVQVHSSGGGSSGGGGDYDEPPTMLRPGLAYSLRGGLTTYHGPGQVVLWPVLDLRSPAHRQLTVRCYSRLLEDTTVAALRGVFGVRAFTTDDPGVWVRQGTRRAREDEDRGGNGDGEAAKIAALGVHLRRHVSALGTAVNLDFPRCDVADERWNPWARIVACGLEGKTVTSVAGLLPGGAREMGEKLAEWAVARTIGSRAPLHDEGEARSVGTGAARMVAGAWAEELARRLGLEGVDAVGLDQIMGLMDSLLASAAAESGEGVEEGVKFLEGIRQVLRDQARCS